MERVWLLVIVDVATRAILGHHLCVNKEYNKDDVLHCIRNTVTTYEIENFRYLVSIMILKVVYLRLKFQKRHGLFGMNSASPLDLPLSDEEDIWLMKLYSSFVKEEPFRENIKYTSITFDPPENFDKDRLISQAAGFTFFQPENINLLGVDLELFAVIGVYNLRISDIIPSKKEPGKLECILENKSD